MTSKVDAAVRRGMDLSRLGRADHEWLTRFDGFISSRPRNGAHLQGDKPEHEMVLTGASRNGNVLRVRCKCMAEYRRVSDQFYGYDWISEVKTLEEAVIVYREHLQTGAKRIHYRVRP